MQRLFTRVLKKISVVTVLFVLASIQPVQAQPIIECDAIGNAKPICGFSNPEDIVVLPGNQAILIGEYGASAAATSAMAA